MSYLDLVEDYARDFKLTLFEKVLLAAKRAKALHLGKMPLVDSLRKDTYLALEELKEGKIELAYREEEKHHQIGFGAEEGDDED
jgi:DNA-directed RNA polymerase subunit K/omega